MKSKLLVIIIISFAVLNVKAADWWQAWESNMEYANQAALETDWPKNPFDPYYVAPGGTSALTLTTEQNHTIGGGKSAKASAALQFSEHYLGQKDIGSIEAWFYDPLTTTTSNNIFGMVEVVRGTGFSLIGVMSAVSKTNYVYRTDTTNWTVTSIQRSQGWHKIVFTFGVGGSTGIGGSIYFDDQFIGNSYTMYQGIWAVEMGNKWEVASDEVFYYDDISYKPTTLIEPYSDTPYGTGGLWHLDNQYTDTAFYSGLSAELTADDDSLNPSRNHNAVLENGPTIESSFVSTLGNCMYFDGMGSHLRVDTAHTDDLGISGNNLRVECWAKIGDPTNYGSPGVNYNYTMLSHYRRLYLNLADTVNGWLLAFNVLNTPTTVATVNVELYLISGFDMATWHHYAAEFYNGTMKVYVDGVLRKTWTAPFTTAMDPEQAFYIGDLGAGQTAYRYFGWLDEVRYSQAVAIAPACGYWGYLPGDINEDCYVNFEDVAIMAASWLDCSIQNQPGCTQF